MNYQKLEHNLIEHCAPTLAGIKSASLFSYFFSDSNAVREKVEEVNDLLNNRGVYVEILLWRENSVLVYTYRRNHLQRELRNPDVMELLQKYGYHHCEIDQCIKHLKKRLYNYHCFPHEIGIFLGYPVEDVRGFIENSGQNCKSCGMWKVYCNEQEKQKLFDKLKKCTEIYLRVFQEGRELSRMPVLA